VWWVDPGQWPDAHPAPFPLPILSRFGGEKMKKLVGRDKGRQIAY